jgi:hypothetical protein
MDERQLFSSMIWALFGLSAVAFVVLMFIPAPYGRFVRRGWVLRFHRDSAGL